MRRYRKEQTGQKKKFRGMNAGVFGRGDAPKEMVNPVYSTCISSLWLRDAGVFGRGDATKEMPRRWIRQGLVISFVPPVSVCTGN